MKSNVKEQQDAFDIITDVIDKKVSELEGIITNNEEEISHLRDLIYDKDQRISELEKQLNLNRNGIPIIKFISGSYECSTLSNDKVTLGVTISSDLIYNFLTMHGLKDKALNTGFKELEDAIQKKLTTGFQDFMFNIVSEVINGCS